MHLSDLKDMLLLSAFLLFPHSHMPGQKHGMIAECDCMVCCMHTDVSSAGYKYLASRINREEDPDAEQEAQDEFLLQLDELESLLSKHAGPYLVGWVPLPSLCLQL